MKKYGLLAFLCAMSLATQAQRREEGSLIIENIPAIGAELKTRLATYQNTRGASFADWDKARGGIYIYTRFGDAAQIHYVGAPKQYREQLTFFPEPMGGVAYCPDPKRRGFLFNKDVGGNEFRQNYWFSLDDGSYTLLTDGKSLNSGGQWNRKGDQFIYATTRRNGKDYDLYIQPAGNPAAERKVFEGQGNWNAADWSHDDQRVIIGNYISANESYLHILDVATGKTTPVNPSTKKIAYGGVVFSKDGKGLYVISDEDSEYQQLRYLDLATGKQTTLTAKLSWDVEGLELSEDGKTLAFTTNEDGIARLYLMSTQNNSHDRVATLPNDALIGGLEFHPDNKQLALTLITSRSAADVYVLDVQSKQLTRWTYSELGGLNPTRFVEPELIRYPTFDQLDGKPRTIPAFVYKPKGKSGKAPVVINIHGGPEGQSRPGFSWLNQYLANEMGIAMIYPNVRGSSGYGKTFLTLDNGFKRLESVQDIGALLDWIKTQPDLDAERVAVYGGSYGGYMVLACMAEYNARLRCGIDVVGISNLATFLKNTSDYRRDLRRAEYGDERDPKMLEFMNSTAPLNNVHKISKPMFIIQGLNDPRVPYTEAEQMLAAIKKNGGPVWFLMAKDEGHGFRKKGNTDYQTAAMMLFLQEHLVK